jgi:ribosomal protein L15
MHEEEGEGEWYEVSRIVGVCHRSDGVVLYRIVWKGYPGEDTWEPESNLRCPDILRAFKLEEKKKMKRKRDREDDDEKELNLEVEKNDELNKRDMKEDLVIEEDDEEDRIEEKQKDEEMQKRAEETCDERKRRKYPKLIGNGDVDREIECKINNEKKQKESDYIVSSIESTVFTPSTQKEEPIRYAPLNDSVLKNQDQDHCEEQEQEDGIDDFQSDFLTQDALL